MRVTGKSRQHKENVQSDLNIWKKQIGYDEFRGPSSDTSVRQNPVIFS
jgi:hypothetical protein